MIGRLRHRSRALRVGIGSLALALGVLGVAVLSRGTAEPNDDETVQVTRGVYADVVEIRGEIQPERSTYVTAPYNAGELQILQIAGNGTSVKAGDVVARFDAVTLRQTIQEKNSELRTAKAELEQGTAQSAITVEERQAAVRKAEFDVTRASLSLGEVGLVSEIEAARATLAVADAEARLREAQAALASARAAADSDRQARERRVVKVEAELARAERQVAALQVAAPTDGTVNILPNYRSTSPMGVAQEYRQGDRAFPGAMILELPDLSSVYLTARIDEADRGHLAVDQAGIIRVDAIPDREYTGRVSLISLLARTDFTSGWPPQKQFDLTLAIVDPDTRLRPGMSAAARITVGQLKDVLLVPATAVFYEQGRTVVYRHVSRGVEAVPVELLRRGRDQAALSASGLAAGDRIARRQPGAAPREETP